MSVDLRTVRRVLRQLADSGCRDVAFGSMTAAEALALVRAARSTEPGTPPLPPATPAGNPAPQDGGHTPHDGDRVPTTGGMAGIREALRATGSDVPRAPQRRMPAGRTAAATTHGAESGVLGELATLCSGCTRCRLHEGRRNVVFGEGSATADLVVVGEAPGQEEDRTGRPFVGRAGKLLDLLLMTAGFARESVYICNVLKCRPPQNRNPLADEVAQCTTTFLHPQLDAIAPRVLVAVGKFAAQALLESEESIGRLRGRVHEYRGTPLVVTYHPAFLLRSPHMNRVAWHDFQLIRKIYDEQG